MKGAQSKRNRSAKSVKVESAGPFSIALSNQENCVKYLQKTLWKYSKLSLMLKVGHNNNLRAATFILPFSYRALGKSCKMDPLFTG